ncbi:arabinosyltransferase domain-containing protein [Actinomycetospora sp. C-140]
MSSDIRSLAPVAADDPPRPGRPTLRRTAGVVAVLAGLVAVIGALLLPFAPVAMSTPEVRWPSDPRDPAPTMLMLTGYEPVTIEAHFSCRAARAAAASPDGVVLSTMGPASRDAEDEALTVRSRDGVLSIRSGGADLFTGPLPTGDCGFVVAGDDDAMRVERDGAVVATVLTRMPPADPDELPDSEPEQTPITPLPDVDALRTSVPAGAGTTADDLSVRLVLDDAFDHSPAPLKSALIVVMVAALVTGALAMAVHALAGRRDPRGARHVLARLRHRIMRRMGAAPRGLRPRAVDVLVPAVLVAWLFLAPLTDDDGYYSAMAANVPFSGYVPNYYQLFNQGYTPFSWPYYALSRWQDVVGVAPVALRLPALLLGIGTWFLARAFVTSTPLLGPRMLSGRWATRLARLVLAAAFLAWWLPYDMGARPEPVIAFFTVATLVAVAEGVERRRLALLGLAVGLAMAGLMAAPTGFIALAPLVAATPAIWRLIRDRSASWWEVAGRWILVGAPVAVGSLLGFADGAYRDFVRSQDIFAPIQRAQTWYAEALRYGALLDTTSHHGSYARRAAVVVCVLALLWFLVLVVAARARDILVPARLPLAGWSMVLAFVLLLPTPSKPTHHLGALAGFGAVFLALVLVDGIRLLAALDRDRRVPQAALVAGAAATVLVAALVWHGRDMWPYGWGLGMPSYGDYPAVRGLDLDQPLWWALGLAVVTGVVGVAARRRAPELCRLALAGGVLITICVLLAGVTAWTLGDAARAAARTTGTWSPQGDAWADPAGSRCGLAQQMDVLDPRGGRVLTPSSVSTGSPAGGFVPGGSYPGSPPPPELPPGTPVWGSFLVPAPGANADARTGSITTDWFRLPPASPGSDVVVAVSGRTGDDVSLRAEYARTTPAGPVPVASRPVATPEESVGWRTVPLIDDDAPPAGADIVRLVAVDGSTTTGGWLAFTAPVERPWVPLQHFLPADGAVGVAWQIRPFFPCLRQPQQQGGITEPAVAAVGWGPTPDEALADWTYDPDRGGLLGHAEREAGGATLLSTRVRGVGDQVDDVWLFDLRQPFPTGGYDLTRTREVVPGTP